MKRKSRLGRSKKLGRKDRLVKTTGCGLDESLSSMNKLYQEAQNELHPTEGDFVEPEVARVKQNIALVHGILKHHPDESILIRVTLEDPPEGTGGIFVCRADDFVQFDNVEVEDLDTGLVFTVRRSAVAKVLGAAKFDASTHDDMGSRYGMPDSVKTEAGQ